MKLSSRQHELIRIIFEGEDYITIEAIAEKLSLSTRTIKRELEEIGMFFETIGVPLERKSGKGVRILKSDSVSELLNSILNKKTIPVFSAEKRAIILLLTLLFSDEALKRFTLASSLGTSELTVSSDLAKCEEILSSKGIELVRKQGYGIYVVASEERRRMAIFEIIEEATKGFSLLEVPSKTMEQFVSRKQLEEIAILLEKCNGESKFYVSDRTRDMLALQLLIQKTRVEVGNKISLAMQNTSDSAVEIASSVIAEMVEFFGVSYSTGEIHFFADVISITQGVLGVSGQNETATYIARKLAKKLEGSLGILVDAENEFFASLITHLIASVGRSEKNIEILNPILGEIKSTYPDIYNMVEECAGEIKSEIGISFNAGEIGYLTMHMCVIALDGKTDRVQKCGALVVCPSGLVASKLLAINLQKAYSGMEILETSSSGDVARLIAENKNIDIVVSTLKVECGNLPLAVVSPFISPSDKDVIEECLKKVSRREIMREVVKIESEIEKGIVTKMQAKDIIADIISGMVIDRCVKGEDIFQISQTIANFYSENEEDSMQIQKDILAREEIGSTVMADGEMMLIHAKTAGVSKPCLGVIKFQNPLAVRGEEKPVQTATVMLAPIDSKLSTKVLSEISQQLVLDDEFYETLKSCEEDKIKEKIKEVLYNYYFENYNR